MGFVCSNSFAFEHDMADIVCTAWEISQRFVTSWPWLVDNEMIRCSNFWRAERGEGSLIVPNLSESIFEEIL